MSRLYLFEGESFGAQPNLSAKYGLLPDLHRFGTFLALALHLGRSADPTLRISRYVYWHRNGDEITQTMSYGAVDPRIGVSDNAIGTPSL